MNLSRKNIVAEESTKENIILYPAMKNTINGKVYGYINNKGLFVIKPRFQIAYDFKYDVAVVLENNKFGVINTNGEYLVKPVYDSIGEFKEGRAIFNLNGNVGVIDDKGNVITEKKYDFIGEFNDELALIAKSYKNGDYRYGYINLKGEEVISPKFIMAYPFKDRIALVKLDYTNYALINENGEILKTYKHIFLYGYNDGVMVYADNFQGPYGYIDNKGKEIIKAKYSEASAFNDGVAIVSYDKNYEKRYGVIDLEGKYVFEPIFSSILSLGEGRVALGLPMGEDTFINRNIYAIASTDGKILTNFLYLYVGIYKDGLACASDEEYSFFINLNGERNKNYPKVKGSGQLLKKEDLIYADIDYMPYYIGKYNEVVYKPNDIIKLDNNYSVFMKKYKPNINYLIYVPNILEHESRKLGKINKRLEEDSYFSPYSENKNQEITKDTILEYNYYGTFDIKFFKKNFISIELNGSYYVLGSAHPMPVRKAENINLITGKFYILEDLFIKNSPWKEYLNTLIKSMINFDKEYNYVFKDSFTGIDNNQNFYIDEDNLYIYFKPYDIAPYSAGFVTFKIPFTQLNKIINKNSEFYMSFN